MTDTIKPSTDNDEAPTLPESLASVRWTFINGWKVEPQSDDRAPVFGEIVPSNAPLSAQRSSARRQHQAMFKEWSRNRHD